MPFFTYSQNNSGGSFDRDESRGIDTYVIVEADSAGAADYRAKEIGLYFDHEYEMDCECCGMRWCEASGEGDAEPTLDGEP